MFIEHAASVELSLRKERNTVDMPPRSGGVLLHRHGYKHCAPNGATFEASPRPISSSEVARPVIGSENGETVRFTSLDLPRQFIDLPDRQTNYIEILSLHLFDEE